MEDEGIARELEQMFCSVDGCRESAAMRFAIEASMIQSEVRNSTDVERIEDLCISGLVEPIISAAELLPEPVFLLGSLLYLDESAVAAEFAEQISKSAISPEEQKRIVGDIDRYKGVLMSKLRRRIDCKAAELADGNGRIRDAISSWLYDLMKFKGEQGRSRPKKVKKGIRNAWQAIKSYARHQDSIFEGMRSNARNARDIAIWYSRYILSPAIENAQNGYVNELTMVTALTDEQMLDDCLFLAKELGIPAREEDFDIMQVRHAMRQHCKARTGYANPSFFLMSLISESEATRLAARFPSSEIARLRLCRDA